MASVNLTLPQLKMEDFEDDAKLQKILSYLYQLNEQLRYELTHIDDDNISGEGISESSFTDSVARTLTNDQGEVLQLYMSARKMLLELSSKVEINSDDLEMVIESLMEIETTAEKLKIQVGEKTVKEQIAEGIEAIETSENTAVTINKDGMFVNTTGRIEFSVDDDPQLTINEEGVNAQLVVAKEVRAENVVQKQLTATVPWKGGIQASIDSLPKYLATDCTLTVPEGTYSEDVVIAGFVGSKLTIQLSQGVKINGTVRIRCCDAIAVNATTIGDAAIYPPTAGLTVGVFACQHVWLTNLQISGYRRRTTSSNGSANVLSIEDSNARVHGCCIEYAGSGAAYVQRGGTFDCAVCSGGSSGNDPMTNANIGYGVQATLGAHGVLRTSVPLSAKGNIATNATLLNSSMAGAAGGMEYVEPEYVTKTFNISKHCTYVYGDKRIRDDQSTWFSQGRYGEYETASHTNYWRIGAIWFADAAAALAGKTIKEAKLTIRRGAGGTSGAIKVYLGSVALNESDFNSTTKPTFTPAATYPIGTLKRETEATYDVTALMDSIKAGQALGVFEPRDDYSGSYSPEYTPFYGKGTEYAPVLTVTYK